MFKYLDCIVSVKQDRTQDDGEVVIIRLANGKIIEVAPHFDVVNVFQDEEEYKKKDYESASKVHIAMCDD